MAKAAQPSTHVINAPPATKREGPPKDHTFLISSVVAVVSAGAILALWMTFLPRVGGWATRNLTIARVITGVTIASATAIGILIIKASYHCQPKRPEGKKNPAQQTSARTSTAAVAPRPSAKRSLQPTGAASSRDARSTAAGALLPRQSNPAGALLGRSGQIPSTNTRPPPPKPSAPALPSLLGSGLHSGDPLPRTNSDDVLEAFAAAARAREMPTPSHAPENIAAQTRATQSARPSNAPSSLIPTGWAGGNDSPAPVLPPPASRDGSLSSTHAQPPSHVVPLDVLLDSPSDLTAPPLPRHTGPYAELFQTRRGVPPGKRSDQPAEAESLSPSRSTSKKADRGSHSTAQDGSVSREGAAGVGGSPGTPDHALRAALLPPHPPRMATTVATLEGAADSDDSSEGVCGKATPPPSAPVAQVSEDATDRIGGAPRERTPAPSVAQVAENANAPQLPLQSLPVVRFAPSNPPIPPTDGIAGVQAAMEPSGRSDAAPSSLEIPLQSGPSNPVITTGGGSADALQRAPSEPPLGSAADDPSERNATPLRPPPPFGYPSPSSRASAPHDRSQETDRGARLLTGQGGNLTPRAGAFSPSLPANHILEVDPLSAPPPPATLSDVTLPRSPSGAAAADPTEEEARASREVSGLLSSATEAAGTAANLDVAVEEVLVLEGGDHASDADVNAPPPGSVPRVGDPSAALSLARDAGTPVPQQLPPPALPDMATLHSFPVLSTDVSLLSGVPLGLPSSLKTDKEVLPGIEPSESQRDDGDLLSLSDPAPREALAGSAPSVAGSLGGAAMTTPRAPTPTSTSTAVTSRLPSDEGEADSARGDESRDAAAPVRGVAIPEGPLSVPAQATAIGHDDSDVRASAASTPPLPPTGIKTNGPAASSLSNRAGADSARGDEPREAAVPVRAGAIPMPRSALDNIIPPPASPSVLNSVVEELPASTTMRTSALPGSVPRTNDHIEPPPLSDHRAERRGSVNTEKLARGTPALNDDLLGGDDETDPPSDAVVRPFPLAAAIPSTAAPDGIVGTPPRERSQTLPPIAEVLEDAATVAARVAEASRAFGLPFEETVGGGAAADDDADVLGRDPSPPPPLSDSIEAPLPLQPSSTAVSAATAAVAREAAIGDGNSSALPTHGALPSQPRWPSVAPPPIFLPSPSRPTDGTAGAAIEPSERRDAAPNLLARLSPQAAVSAPVTTTGDSNSGALEGNLSEPPLASTLSVGSMEGRDSNRDVADLPPSLVTPRMAGDSAPEAEGDALRGETAAVRTAQALVSIPPSDPSIAAAVTATAAAATAAREATTGDGDPDALVAPPASAAQPLSGPLGGPSTRASSSLERLADVVVAESSVTRARSPNRTALPPPPGGTLIERLAGATGRSLTATAALRAPTPTAEELELADAILATLKSPERGGGRTPLTQQHLLATSRLPPQELAALIEAAGLVPQSETRGGN